LDELSFETPSVWDKRIDKHRAMNIIIFIIIILLLHHYHYYHYNDIITFYHALLNSAEYKVTLYIEYKVAFYLQQSTIETTVDGWPLPELITVSTTEMWLIKNSNNNLIKLSITNDDDDDDSYI